MVYLNEVTEKLGYSFMWKIQLRKQSLLTDVEIFLNLLSLQIKPGYDYRQYFIHLQTLVPIKLLVEQYDDYFTINDTEVYQALWLTLSPPDR